MTSEIKENEIDTSNEEVTHLEFVGDRASDYDHELFVSELLCIGGLKWCKPISDQTIVAIAHSCPNLRYLSLKGCHNITDVSVNRLLQHIHNLEYLELDQCRFITDSSICNIANYCPKLEHLDISASDASDTTICNILTNVSKDALSKLNPKIKIKRDSVLDMRPEKELNDLQITLVNLVQYLWLTYANLKNIVQYCEDKIKDEHYQKLIVELERDMRGMAERFSLMIKMYGLKEKINYQLTNPELDTNYAITEFVPRDINIEVKNYLHI
ncbi:11953_t:CDS:2 [Funneliformis mosseae]|uniref:11953_t:CDS:1 n=1 Tax=Funneliformis mosseae TaxID=27381 RepID=A0A9N8Z9K6_FUNMO|nr:11953_t:CDS:2 [Funneliformis mosseae]